MSIAFVRTLLFNTLVVATRAIAATQPLSISGEIQLARLVDLSAQQLQIDVQYDARQLQQRVTLRLEEAIDAERLWSLTNDLLAANGLTSVRRAGSDVYAIVSLQAAAGLAAIETDPAVARRAGYATLKLDLQHADPASIVPTIQPMLSRPGGSATAVAGSRSILISDFGARVGVIAELIERVDQEARPYAASEYTALSATPSVLVDAATAVVEARQEASGLRHPRGSLLASFDGRTVLIVSPPGDVDAWRGLLAQLDRRGAMEARTLAVDGFPLEQVITLVERTVEAESVSVDERFRAVADPLTGSLLITATADQHATIAALIQRLDSLPASARRTTRTFVIQNRDASEIVSIADEVIGGGMLGDAPALKTDGESTPAIDLVLTADDATNSIIAIGNPRRMDQLRAIIADLDVRQPQVQLEILLVSLTQGDTLDLGVEIQGLIRSGSIQARLSSLFGLSSSGDDGRTVGDASGFTGLVLSPGEFSVVLRALETINDGRSVSMPRLIVGNNKSATLDSVVQEPFLSTNASDTVATTSFGGTQDAGTTVTVTPQIAQADHLVLEYSVSLSSFVGESSDPSIPPPRQQNSVQSVVTIPDGFTVAVGGIELMTEADAESRVPIVGSIPIIGEFAKSRSRSNSRSRFYVFIRPTILRDRGFDDLKYLSETEADEAAIDDGWPEVAPRLIR